MNLRVVTGPAIWSKSMARMYITLFILLGALNRIITLMDMPTLISLEVFIGWQLIAEYSRWQFTLISTTFMVCWPVEKTTPPSSACLVQAVSLTSIVAAMYFTPPLRVEVIVVQRMSGPRGALYGCLATFAAYCQSNATKSSRRVGSSRAVFDTKKRASTSCAETHTGSHQKSRKDFVYHGRQGVAGLVINRPNF
jgi:hypothetical protein